MLPYQKNPHDILMHRKKELKTTKLTAEYPKHAWIEDPLPCCLLLEPALQRGEQAPLSTDQSDQSKPVL